MANDLVGDYLDELTLGRSPRTVRLRRYQLRDWERWLHPRGVCEAQRRDIIGYLTRWECLDTRASRRDALSGFYRWTRLIGQIPRSPAEFVEVSGRGEPDPHPAPDHIVTAALAHTDVPTRRAIVLGRFAGLRAAEIAAVHTRDLGYRPDHLRVVGKGNKTRYVPAHDRVVDLLTNEVGEGFVFPGRNDPTRHWTASPISKRVSAALAGPWTCHSLRHAFATALYEECLDWVIVQEALGHSSIDTTKRYVLVRPDRAVAAVRRLSLAAA